MTGEKVPIIKLKASLGDPRGILIPRGMIGHLNVEIADQVATFWFTESRITRRFAGVVIRLEKERGVTDTVYMERFNKIVTKYEDKTKEEIRDLILSQLKQMGANVKKR